MVFDNIAQPANIPWFAVEVRMILAVVLVALNASPVRWFRTANAGQSILK